MEEMSCVFLFIFFSLPLIFSLVAASISYSPTAATKFSCCSSNKKKSLLCLLSLALFSRWASLACRLLSLFLCIPNLWTWQSKLNTLDNTVTETISAFRFRLYWLFSYLCFTRRVAKRPPSPGKVCHATGGGEQWWGFFDVTRRFFVLIRKE